MASGINHRCSKDGAEPTDFAPAERASDEELLECLDRISNNPILDTLLQVLGGWVAVLNEHRQVVAVNHALLHALGISDPATALGLRPGEALECAHSQDHPGGCGTSRACSTCGAVIAIVSAQESGTPQERQCVLTTGTEATQQDRVFDVRCVPLELGGENVLLLCMQDVSDEQRRMALERAYLHDTSNILTALVATVDRLRQHQTPGQGELLNRLRGSANTLMREVTIQRLLSQGKAEDIQLCGCEVWPDEVVRQVDTLLASHPAAAKRNITVEWSKATKPIKSDLALVVRVLTNMALNAVEAGQAGDEIRLGFTEKEDSVTFKVWNRQAIPENVVPRIFQKHFSTKNGNGRGIGTYSMKLIGESILKGTIDFETSTEGGTTFRFTLPSQSGFPT